MGEDLVDIVDPGLINIEEQAYPPPLPGVSFELTPLQLAELLSASLFTTPRPQNDVTSSLFPTPSEVVVGDQVFTLPPLSLGADTPIPVEVDVSLQNLVDGRFLEEWIVTTEAGNFRINETENADEDPEFTVTSVLDADTGGAVTLSTTRFRIFVTPANLTSFGLSLLFREAEFFGEPIAITAMVAATPISVTTTTPHGFSTGAFVTLDDIVGTIADGTGSLNGRTFQITVTGATTFTLDNTIGVGAYVSGGTVISANDGATKTIEFFDANYVVVSRTEQTESGAMSIEVPAAGDKFLVDVERRGSEAVYDTGPPTLDVFISPPPPLAEQSEAPLLGFQGNITGSSGVINPFIGAGLPAPPFIGTFQVESQTFGMGLPANVFV